MTSTQHENGRRVATDLTLAAALSGQSPDPGVGKLLEFRIVRDPAQPDQSQVTAVLIPNPDLSRVPVSRTRQFVFGDGGQRTTNDPVTSGKGPWGIGTDGGDQLDADFGRISAAPKFGTREVWTLVNDGGDWDHPIHIHFEESQILARNASANNVPAWETGRKGDVLRLRPDGSVTVTLQFRDSGGMFIGALAQHHPRGQRHAAAVGDRRQWCAVYATAADTHPEAAGRDLPATGPGLADGVLRPRPPSTG